MAGDKVEYPVDHQVVAEPAATVFPAVAVVLMDRLAVMGAVEVTEIQVPKVQMVMVV